MTFAKFFRKYHRWLALVIGVQIVIWCLSGLYMTAVHISYIHGNHLVNVNQTNYLNDPAIKPLSPDQIKAIDQPIKSIQLVNSFGKPIYRIRTEKQLYRINALTLEQLNPVTKEIIRENANRIYQGSASISSVSLLEQYPNELGGTKQNIWRVTYDDLLSSTLYFSSDTGELRSKRTTLWRLFDFLWMLHIMDYETREVVNNNILTFGSLIGLLLAFSGIGLLFYSFRHQKNIRLSQENLLRKIHRWLALLIGIQLTIWLLSGLMFSLLDQEKVSGAYLLKQSKVETENFSFDKNDVIVSAFNSRSLEYLFSKNKQIKEVKTVIVLNDNYLEIKTKRNKFLVRANDLAPKEINEDIVKQIASQHYNGDGLLREVIQETQRTTENRKWSLPIWRVDFNDLENSSVYIDVNNGRVKGLKTDTWRLFDIFWMLHIMDYSERNDMNNSLVIFIAVLASFFTITGLLLITRVFQLKDFNIIGRLRKRNITFLDAKTGKKEKLLCDNNAKLFDILMKAGHRLPSVCGGGGVCGLCKVYISKANDDNNPDSEIKEEIVLACQYRVSSDIIVTVVSKTHTIKN